MLAARRLGLAGAAATAMRAHPCANGTMCSAARHALCPRGQPNGRPQHALGALGQPLSSRAPWPPRTALLPSTWLGGGAARTLHDAPLPPDSGADTKKGAEKRKPAHEVVIRSSGMSAKAAFKAVAGPDATELDCDKLFRVLQLMHPQFSRIVLTELRDELRARLGADRVKVTAAELEKAHHVMADKIDPRIWPIAASTALIGAAVGVIIPAMPVLATELGIGPAQYGIVIGGLALTKLIGNIPASNAADKHGRKRIIVNGLYVMAVANAIIGLASGMDLLLAGRLLSGVGVAMFVTSSALYSTDVSNVLNRARTMAPLGIAFSVGATLGPAIGGFLTSAIGIPNTFYLVGATFGALAIVTNYALTETLKVKIERKYSTYWHALSEETSEWRGLLRNPSIRSTVLFNLAYWVAFSGCQMTILPLMLIEDRFGLGPAGVGMVFMGTSLINVVCAQPAAALADRYGKPQVFLPAAMLVAAAFAAFPLASNLVEAGVVLGAAGLGNALLGNAPTAHVADCATPEARSKALALLRTSGDIGMLIGSGTVGMLAGWLNSKGAAMEANAVLFGVATAAFIAREMSARRSQRP